MVIGECLQRKSDALTCGSYRGINLLEHAMKVLEKVVKGRVKEIVIIDNMHSCSFDIWKGGA